jgi:hypothetical protein
MMNELVWQDSRVFHSHLSLSVESGDVSLKTLSAGQRAKIPSLLTRILTPSHLYLIDMGNKGRAWESRPPPPHPPGNLFLTGKSFESR